MNYIGITVGPILETMERTSSPAGVWFSSYFFSIITRDICLYMQEKGYDIFSLPEGHIVKEHLGDSPGIGRYHDRIYACKNIDTCKMGVDIKEIIKEVLWLRAQELEECKAYDRIKQDIYDELSSYVRIHYIILQEEETLEKGIVKSLSDALDCLELSHNVNTNIEKQYLYRVMYGTKEQGSNIFLRKYPPLIAAASNKDFLLADNTEKGIEVHNIEYLSTLGTKDIDDPKTPKVRRYFAIVQCDGDNMGYLLTDKIDLSDREAQKKRQQKVTGHCIEFAESVIKDISAFGGYAIYAGGDDLLFLAPVIGRDHTTIWDFCNRISVKFTECFKDLANDGIDYSAATLSVGLSINYYKYPLYEAMADVRNQLFDVAKKYTNGRHDATIKNNIAVTFRKASGSSSGFAAWMDSSNPDGKNIFREFIEMIKQYYLTGDANVLKDKDRMMHSLLYHLESIHELFVTALRAENLSDSDLEKQTQVRRVFHNYFDNVNQSFGKNMVTKTADFALLTAENYRNNLVKGLGGSGKNTCDHELFAVTSMLRTAKFLLEERK